MSAQQQDLRLYQGQRLRLTQQQFQFVRLLELNAPEFDEAVERELEANPALESDSREEDRHEEDPTPYYLRRTVTDKSDDRDYDFSPADEQESLYDYLTRQIGERDLPAEVAATAEYIVGNLDSNGYLQRPLHSMIDDLAFNQGVEIDKATADKALEVVRSLDPPGVGAENLRECLLLQLKALPPSQTRDDATAIISDYFEPFTMRHSHRIISGLKISDERVREANELIVSLNPKPGAPFGGERETAAGIIVPDFAVSNEEGILTITVNNRYPDLRIEQSFSEAMQGLEKRRGRARKGKEFVINRFNEARDFIQLVQQRQQTLLAVMTAITDMQREYFETGDVYRMKPMMIKDIKARTGLDLSVISRATNNKYVATPWGAVMPLRAFFSDVKGDEESGETLTNRQIEAQIEAIIDAEDKRHPLSDEKIRLEMLRKGYDLSRRTIAKYRDRKGILVARLRKKI